MAAGRPASQHCSQAETDKVQGSAPHNSLMSQLCTVHITLLPVTIAWPPAVPGELPAPSMAPAPQTGADPAMAVTPTAAHTAFPKWPVAIQHKPLPPRQVPPVPKRDGASKLQRTGNSAKHGAHGQHPALSSRAFNPSLPGGPWARASGHHLWGEHGHSWHLAESSHQGETLSHRRNLNALQDGTQPPAHRSGDAGPAITT